MLSLIQFTFELKDTVIVGIAQDLLDNRKGKHFAGATHEAEGSNQVTAIFQRMFPCCVELEELFDEAKPLGVRNMYMFELVI
ncbi:MAG: hypothetical protein COV10_00855 [Candidatus Vogelbacteria bacterium CG10_big_fil_rev_8_21_14_0_10_51_16]|uniref:Uncharacterized protein n=1 Tax=Candidatus Vogelbacteria bacterium CG10_big_fil_rev_8_21_14_0_10_51_16 TaxID=1975045 RepID=A0A2H0RF32_9BACT|nr:MAG: hypothetical protein COV10_00855 [Candidatus Vogelbacteria bacterium CG10_big_fil_rev_8_21_14_0_10_51_16]